MLLDGQNGLGMVISTQAMGEAIKKAKRKGAGIVVVRNSNHFGAAALYAMKAVENDMIGLALTNAPAAMAPWGSIQPYLGTNPICVAVPAGREKPFVLDMATSMATRGALKIAAKRNEKIPLGWAMDSQGRQTQDPQKALQGSLLPIGGPKGYGLALVVDILCGVLSGAGFGGHIGDLFGDLSQKQNLGHFFTAIDVASFMPIENFKKRMDQIITEIKLCRRAEGVQQIFIPGEIEFLTQARRLREGIPVSRTTLFELQQVASQVGVDFDLVVLSNEHDSPSPS
jgi:LDH2 family malate/lactate/ureidoglycolate dehydrogenase